MTKEIIFSVLLAVALLTISVQNVVYADDKASTDTSKSSSDNSGGSTDTKTSTSDNTNTDTNTNDNAPPTTNTNVEVNPQTPPTTVQPTTTLTPQTTTTDNQSPTQPNNNPCNDLTNCGQPMTLHLTNSTKSHGHHSSDHSTHTHIVTHIVDSTRIIQIPTILMPIETPVQISPFHSNDSKFSDMILYLNGTDSHYHLRGLIKNILPETRDNMVMAIMMNDKTTGALIHTMDKSIFGTIKPNDVRPFDIDVGYNSTQADELSRIKITVT
jgi:hypothetical protein